MISSMNGKFILITGGSRGIGLVVAKKFAQAGAAILLIARNAEELQRAKESLASLPGSGQIHTLAADISKLISQHAINDFLKQNLARVDVLINAAGIYGPIGPAANVDPQLWLDAITINLFGSFAVIQSVLPFMIKAGSGKIINFAGGGDGPFANFSAYSASKAAMIRFTETLAEETREFGIDVNIIAPGAVNTRFLDEALAAGKENVGPARYQSFLKQQVDGGVSPEIAASLCYFLSSSSCNGLTGKYISAIWDDWRNWTPEQIAEIASSDRLTLRRKK